MNKLLVSFVVLLSFLKNSYCETKCERRNTCQCVFQNGSIIDLSSLGNKNNEPRWKGIKAQQDKGYEFFYNPCYSFTLGNTGDCSKGVAICQVSVSPPIQYFDCGDTDSANFVVDSNNTLHLMYTAIQKTTNVTLICSEDAIEPELKVEREVNSVFEMTLRTRCACPDLCAEYHLSTGSVLVILFMVFVALYLLLGIVHASLTRGAHGWELIPHYEFWTDFPLLVRDGCVFVFSGCKPETAYDRI